MFLRNNGDRRPQRVLKNSVGSIVAQVAAAIGLMISATLALPAAATPGVPGTQVLSLPVTFQVVNRNDSNVPCLADGKTYTVRGHLVGQAGRLGADQPGGDFLGGVTTYVHGIGWGEYYWHFQSQPDYDYASQMADRGHVSLVYDQLGYGASDRTPGLFNCYGSEASVASQIISALKSGRYTVEGRRRAPVFQRVALASNQAAALVSQPAAYSYGNADALIVTSFADFAGAFKPAFALQSAPFFSQCLLGGERSDGPGGSGPKFYVNFPPSDDAFASVNFANADPAIIAAATAARGRSPCGEALSAFQTIGLDTLQILLRQVRVPVLIVNGLDDAFFAQPLGGNFQRNLYPNSPNVTVEFIANAGQALTLERTAPDFRNVMDAWLRARRF